MGRQSKKQRAAYKRMCVRETPASKRATVPCPAVDADFLRWARDTHSHYKHLPATGILYVPVPQIDQNTARLRWSFQPLSVLVPDEAKATRTLQRCIALLTRHAVRLNCFVSGACRPGDEKSNTHGAWIIFDDYHDESWPYVQQHHPDLFAALQAKIARPDFDHFYANEPEVHRLFEREFARQAQEMHDACHALWKAMRAEKLSVLSFRVLWNLCATCADKPKKEEEEEEEF